MNAENNYKETDLGNVAPNPRGEFSEAEEYEYLDYVYYQGGSYLCLAELGTTIVGFAPEAGKTTQYWQAVALPGGLTPEYVAMHDLVVNLSEQVSADTEEVRESKENIEGMETNVENLQSQATQSAQEAEESKTQAAGCASAAEASRQAAETSEQNINAQVTGFDEHVAKKTSSVKTDIEAARIAANKAVVAQQEESVQEVKNKTSQYITEKQSEAEQAIANKQSEAVEAVNTAGTTQTDAVNTAGEEQKKAVESAGQEALNNIGNGVDATLSMDGKAADSAATGKAVDELKSDLDNNTISKKIRTGKNLFNKERATVGFIDDSITIGKEQTIDPSYTSASTDIIPINPNNAYTLSGFREIVVTDVNKCKLDNVRYIENGTTLTLHPSDFRNEAAFLFASAYNVNIGVNTQVEIGETPTEYEEYKEYDVFEQGEKEIDNFPNVSLEKRLSEAEKKLNEIKPDTQIKDIKKTRTVRSFQKINVAGGSKVILHLHKRKTEGAGTVNDVYLPFASSDFSDVRVKAGSIDIPYMLMSRIDGIDIIQDDRLGRNSSGQVLQNSDGEWYVGFGNAVKKSTDGGKTWTNVSTFELGKTWVVCEFLHDDTMLLSLKGVLYRSEKPYTSYTKVLDTNESYTQVFILAENVHELPDHTVILGCYQGERVIRIYKSTDGGKNWNRCYYDDSGKYQHIHNMYVDMHAQPVAIYAGCDGGGGILKSTDSGETWIDLRNGNVPQATDEGVIYADESGYRMLSGETSVVGGYTLVKTYDDITFTPNLGVGNGCFAMEKYKGLLIAPLLCSTNHRNTAIAVSSNDGDDWDIIFTTSPLNHDNGASDGFRYMSKLSNGEKEELIIGCQSSTQPPVRITEGAYAEIIVDIPKEVSEITVESGYVGADYENSYNNYTDIIERLASYNLASSTEQENYVEGGKKLSFLYPPIVKDEDAYAMDFSHICENPLTFEADLSNVSAITISYWCKNITGGFYTVIEENDSGKNYGFKTNWGFLYDLPNGDSICEFRSQQCMDVWSKIDFIINFNNSSISLFVNGSKTIVKEKTSDNIKTQLDGLKKSNNFSMFRKLTGNPTGAIQHVDVFNGIKTEKQIYDGYNDGLTDMVNE